MMDHYEELGVARSASLDEIRQAYKRLVRLIHPDHCRDEEVRLLADLQMKRLNGVLRTLTNPDERALYDRATFGGTAPRGLPPSFLWSRGILPWYWHAGGAVALLVLVFVLVHSPQSTPRKTQPPEQSSAVATAPALRPVSRALPHDIEPRVPPPEEPYPEPELPQVPSTRIPPNDAPAPRPEIANVSASPIVPVEMPPLTAPSAEAIHTAPRPQWSGDWLFVAAPHPKASGLYLPEFIELHVTEKSGILRGRYRARYHIPDQAISPTVAFQFEGQGGQDRANLPWIGAGGAAGQVRLRLLTPAALEVIWVATQLGGDLGLISGTATLVRKMD